MTIVYYELSNAGIEKEMLKGISARKHNQIEIELSELSESDRKLLLSHSAIDDDSINIGVGAYRTDYGKEWRGFVELDSTDIIAALKLIEEKEKVQKEIKAAQLEEYEEKFNAIVAQNRTTILGNKKEALKVEIEKFGWDGTFFNPNELKVDQETYDFIVKCHQEQEAEERKVAREKREARQGKETADKELAARNKELLKNWAIQNGSELVKLRIEENMNWKDEADKEYFASILPTDFQYLVAPNESWPIKDATIEQIKALREIKIHYPDAALLRYKYIIENDDSDDDDDDTIIHKDVITITLKNISGKERIYEKVLNS